jgi:hypothetical protein
MPRQIEGSQTDFSFGEVDVTLKRNDQHPAHKGGLRQMANARILNSGAIQDRPGRSALFFETGRVEKVLMSPDNLFYLAFGAGTLRVYNAAGTRVFSSTLKGDGETPIPWTLASVSKIVYAQTSGANQLQIYICYGDDVPVNVPQVLTWDGVSQTSEWLLTNFAELVEATFQKRTIFFRISPANVTMQPSNTSGNGTITFSENILVEGMIGTRMEFCGSQLTITGITSGNVASVDIDENLPEGQQLLYNTNVSNGIFAVGQELIGSESGAIGIITVVVSGNLSVQLLPQSDGNVAFFQSGELAVGPNGSAVLTGSNGISPQAVSTWTDEVMNLFRGFPTSVFFDQSRLGFCNFPALPSGIGWSAINTPTDFFADTATSPDDAIFEFAPNKAQVLYVVPGPEGSEFVFCDIALYYIPISTTSPLAPGSVGFTLLSGDGSAQVQPRLAQQAIIYSNAGQNGVNAVIATGSITQPFNTKMLSNFHQHLFNDIQAIAVPNADGTFLERYAYVLNGDSSIAVGKYDPEGLLQNMPVIGWGPWSGAGIVSYIAAQAETVVFTSSYFGMGIVEILDDTQFLDSAISVNSPPAPFAAAQPAGKGPLWFAAGQSVTLIDQVTRVMGTYQIDQNGNIIPQFNGGENLEIASLVAGQPWTMTVEPFAPISSPGQAMNQRLTLRQISLIGIYVINSTGFTFFSLFSAKQTSKTPPLGTLQQFSRRTPWNQGDNPTLPPTLRETVETWTPPGSSYDPRVAIVKDVPGPLEIQEIAFEISI